MITKLTKNTKYHQTLNGVNVFLPVQAPVSTLISYPYSLSLSIIIKIVCSRVVFNKLNYKLYKFGSFS